MLKIIRDLFHGKIYNINMYRLKMQNAKFAEKKSLDNTEAYGHVLRLYMAGKTVIGRQDLLSRFGGDYFFNMLNNEGILGDRMRNLDNLVREILSSLKDNIKDNCALVEERCINYQNGNCRRKGIQENLKGRKSCRDSAYTTACNTINLKIDYNAK